VYCVYKGIVGKGSVIDGLCLVRVYAVHYVQTTVHSSE